MAVDSIAGWAEMVAAIDLALEMVVEEQGLVVDMEYLVAESIALAVEDRAFVVGHNLLEAVHSHLVAAFVVANLGLVAAAFVSPLINNRSIIV